MADTLQTNGSSSRPKLQFRADAPTFNPEKYKNVSNVDKKSKLNTSASVKPTGNVGQDSTSGKEVAASSTQSELPIQTTLAVTKSFVSVKENSSMLSTKADSDGHTHHTSQPSAAQTSIQSSLSSSIPMSSKSSTQPVDTSKNVESTKPAAVQQTQEPSFDMSTQWADIMFENDLNESAEIHVKSSATVNDQEPKHGIRGRGSQHYHGRGNMSKNIQQGSSRTSQQSTNHMNHGRNKKSSNNPKFDSQDVQPHQKSHKNFDNTGKHNKKSNNKIVHVGLHDDTKQTTGTVHTPQRRERLSSNASSIEKSNRSERELVWKQRTPKLREHTLPKNVESPTGTTVATSSTPTSTIPSNQDNTMDILLLEDVEEQARKVLDTVVSSATSKPFKFIWSSACTVFIICADKDEATKVHDQLVAKSFGVKFFDMKPESVPVPKTRAGATPQQAKTQSKIDNSTTPRSSPASRRVLFHGLGGVRSLVKTAANDTLTLLRRTRQELARIQRTDISTTSSSNKPSTQPRHRSQSNVSTSKQPKNVSTPKQQQNVSTPKQQQNVSTPKQHQNVSTPTQQKSVSTPTQQQNVSTPTQPKNVSTATQPKKHEQTTRKTKTTQSEQHTTNSKNNDMHEQAKEKSNKSKARGRGAAKFTPRNKNKQ